MAPSSAESTDHNSPQSSLSPSSLYQRDSMSSMSTAPTSLSNHAPMSPVEEGVSTGAQNHKSKGLGERARGLMGSRFGSGKGSPPLGLPPPPPIPASAQAGPSRPNVFNRASSRLSSLPLRQTPAPAYPPPTSALPPPPPSAFTASNPPPARSASISRSLRASEASDQYGRHQRQGSGVSQQSTASSISIPPSPSGGAPPISPRTSSLASQRSAMNAAIPSAQPTNQAEASSSSSPNTVSGRRVPSRQLLQTALDLAQRAVEMDQGNDVIGALSAYREAVTRLKAVMERVGMEGREGRKGKNGKAEEEGRTLKGIHDAYVARVLLLESYENGEEPNPDDNSLSGFPTPPASQPSMSRGLPSFATTSSSFSSATSTPGPPEPLTQPASPSPASRTPNPFVFPGDHTPRPSMEGGMSSEGHGIGNFMLADQSFEPNTPDRPEMDATPQQASHATPSRPPRGQDALPVPDYAEEPFQSQPLNYGLTIMNGNSSSTVVLQESSTAATMLEPPPRRESLSSTAALGIGHPGTPPRFDSAGSPTSDTPTSRRARALNPSMGLEDEAGLTAADGLLEKEDMEEMMETQDERTPSANGVLLLHSRSDSLDKSLPPIPVPVRASSHSRQSSLSRLGQLISETTSRGTISQRRLSRNSASIATADDGVSSLPSSKSMAMDRLSGANYSPSSYGSRTRSKSQPGQRPGEAFQAESADDVPPLPNLRKKASFPSHPHQRHSRIASESLLPPDPGSYRSTSPSSFAAGREPTSAMSFSGSLISPVPEIQPEDTLHRPFHLLRTIHLSMDPDGPGAYLTGAIHIPSSIWSTSPSSAKSSRGPGPQSSNSGSGLKITAQDTKVRIMDALILHLEIIRHTGAVLLEGPREVGYGVPGVAPPRIGGQAVAGVGQELLGALDGLEDEMDGVYKSLVKAGVPVGAWKGKKASASTRSWGSKVVRSMDKMTSSKAIDSADKYVDLLASLCSNLQVLNDHLTNFTGPCTPAYHYISEPGYRALEQRLGRSAEFVRVVLIPFVLDDFKQFFYRYLKAGMRYIED